MKIPSAPIRVVVAIAPNGKWEMHSGVSTAQQQRTLDESRDRILMLIHQGRFERTHGVTQDKRRYVDREYVRYYMPYVRMKTEPSDEEPEGGFTFRPLHETSLAKTVDGREYLDALLNVKTPTEALEFLDKYGNPDDGPYTEFARIRKLQDFLGQAGMTPVQKWTEQLPDWAAPKSISIELSADAPPGFVFRHNSGVVACCAQIFFERIEGMEYAWCELEDCGQPFRKTRADKKHCCVEHQHLALIRRSRAAKKAKQSRSKSRRGTK